MELIKPDVNVDFAGRRYLAFMASGLLILITVISLIARGGPNYGIDFAGGILVQVRFDKVTNPAQIKDALKPIGMDDSLVQRFGASKDNEYLIRAEKSDLKLEGLADKVRVVLSKKYGKGFEVRRVEMVGPKVGKDLRRKALLAIYYAILLIAVYISGRFEAKWGLAAVMAAVLVGATLLVQALMASLGDEDSGLVWLIVTSLVVTVGACWLLHLRYALGAIVALIHDVTITVGAFSLMNLEFTLATVAALLTIIGYSLNDTIIVFDRIRENLKRGVKEPLADTINHAVNQTLSRTILTSGTTLVVVVALYVLGGGVIRDFAFALMVGVVVGTYSSIFVASPILLALPEAKHKAPAKLKAGKAKASAPPPEPKEAKKPSAAKVAAGKQRSKSKGKKGRRKR